MHEMEFCVNSASSLSLLELLFKVAAGLWRSANCKDSTVFSQRKLFKNPFLLDSDVSFCSVDFIV